MQPVNYYYDSDPTGIGYGDTINTRYYNECVLHYLCSGESSLEMGRSHPHRDKHSSHLCPHTAADTCHSYFHIH